MLSNKIAVSFYPSSSVSKFKYNVPFPLSSANPFSSFYLSVLKANSTILLLSSFSPSNSIPSSFFLIITVKNPSKIYLIALVNSGCFRYLVSGLTQDVMKSMN